MKNKNKTFALSENFQIQQKNYKKKKIRNPNTQIHDRSIFWIDTGTSMKSGGVKLV